MCLLDDLFEKCHINGILLISITSQQLNLSSACVYNLPGISSAVVVIVICIFFTFVLICTISQDIVFKKRGCHQSGLTLTLQPAFVRLVEEIGLRWQVCFVPLSHRGYLSFNQTEKVIQEKELTAVDRPVLSTLAHKVRRPSYKLKHLPVSTSTLLYFSSITLGIIALGIIAMICFQNQKASLF